MCGVWLFNWQGLIGAIVGASAPFLLWRVNEWYRERKSHKENLYYLERLLVDQVYFAIDASRILKDFIDNKLSKLIENINSENENSYFIGHAFLPFFSARSLSNDIHKVTTKSGYIDYKLSHAYELSQNIPLIIDDMRRQFDSIIQINRDIALGKLNSPTVQKKNYILEIERFSNILSIEMINTNIPIYLKSLIQTRIALTEFIKLGFLRWQIKFNPKYRLSRIFESKSNFNETMRKTHELIEEYLAPMVDDELEKIKNVEDQNLTTR